VKSHEQLRSSSPVILSDAPLLAIIFTALPTVLPMLVFSISPRQPSRC
jgi:hypothetical protein